MSSGRIREVDPHSKRATWGGNTSSIGTHGTHGTINRVREMKCTKHSHG